MAKQNPISDGSKKITYTGSLKPLFQTPKPKSKLGKRAVLLNPTTMYRTF